MSFEQYNQLSDELEAEIKDLDSDGSLTTLKISSFSVPRYLVKILEDNSTTLTAKDLVIAFRDFLIEQGLTYETFIGQKGLRDSFAKSFRQEDDGQIYLDDLDDREFLSRLSEFEDHPGILKRLKGAAIRSSLSFLNAIASLPDESRILREIGEEPFMFVVQDYAQTFWDKIEGLQRANVITPEFIAKILNSNISFGMRTQMYKRYIGSEGFRNLELITPEVVRLLFEGYKLGALEYMDLIIGFDWCDEEFVSGMLNGRYINRDNVSHAHIEGVYRHFPGIILEYLRKFPAILARNFGSLISNGVVPRDSMKEIADYAVENAKVNWSGFREFAREFDYDSDQARPIATSDEESYLQDLLLQGGRDFIFQELIDKGLENLDLMPRLVAKGLVEDGVVREVLTSAYSTLPRIGEEGGPYPRKQLVVRLCNCEGPELVEINRIMGFDFIRDLAEEFPDAVLAGVDRRHVFFRGAGSQLISGLRPLFENDEEYDEFVRGVAAKVEEEEEDDYWVDTISRSSFDGGDLPPFMGEVDWGDDDKGFD